MSGTHDPAVTEQSVRRMAIIGYGFIGRRVARLAASRGWSVRALARRQPPEDDAGVEVQVGDAGDHVAMSALLTGTDHVVFAAGTTKPAESNEHPMAEVGANLTPLLCTLEEMVSHRVGSLTLLSSAGTVYGPEAPVPTSEDAPLWPISSYGVLKVAAERYVHLYAREHQFAADILRVSNVYGPGEPTSGSQGLIGITRARLSAGLPVVVYGDGAARRDFIHVDDLVASIEALARRPEGVRVLNVGSGRSESVAEVVDAVAHALDVAPVFHRRPARPTDAAVVQLDVSRIRELIAFEPRDVRTALLEDQRLGRDPDPRSRHPVATSRV